ncbi:hypothetical protein [Mesorhizobium sp.]|uniref:hypothetical protein n=1 Tax=Mesorhizobium sp. TaxID=1871066 RepID=UPI000FE8D388|nr:hypothetical protein [Mesorhizobium sp.]RWC57561.1 MAG: hypothetical protein EOS29_24485 [Mesorhizobium sp.]RWC60929.1 MAG: hypothetical protein EOS56_12660 [Mesorhizobium sp.]TIX25795.1 MAG: hypothetical protein E5V35_13025 [Mesorhizobium sp.]
MLIHRLATLTGLAVATLFLAAPANALTMAECSTKYNAAKDAGTLAGATWNQFRKAQCGTDAAATTDAKPADTKKAAETKPAKAAKAAAAADDSTAKGLTAKECSTKYQAAKAAGTLNGMKWNDFRKSECAAGASAAADTKPATTKAAAAPADGKGLSMAECSTKYQAAKTANTLKGMKWNDFRKTECGAGASDDDTVPAADEASYTKEPAKPTTAAPKGVTFPSAISPKYASETPGKGRMHTCLDQYYALKDANALGGLKWIQKGGGFYSLCNAKLKS